MTDLLADLCPECEKRGGVYRLGACIRCQARLVSREPQTIAAITGEGFMKSMNREQQIEFERMIREERDADRKLREDWE